MHWALFFHLVSVTIGFGAVIATDICGLLWVLGKRSTRDLLNFTGVTQPLIWLGYGGLIVSGLFLRPNLHHVLTDIKLSGVVIVGLNGIYLHFIRLETKRLGDKKFVDTPLSYKLKSFWGISVSQLFWWTAIVIGFLTATKK